MRYKPEQQRENRRWWVEALRSGDYRQGRGALHVTDHATGETSFCCMGVACILALQEGVVDQVVYESAYSRQTFFGYEDDRGQSSGIPPMNVVEWLGLPDRWGMGEYGVLNALTKLNDVGVTFSDIADVIEERWGT